MNTKTLSTRAISVIDQYLHFRVGMAVCSIPYFNNKVTRSRVALRAYVGKGSPQDIFEEVQAFTVYKNRIQVSALADESLKKILVDNNMGIDCSGFAYYILNAENEERGKGTLEKHLSFPYCTGMVAKIRCSLRPVENLDVATLAHDKNSRVIPLRDLQPGDMITMTNQPMTSSIGKPLTSAKDSGDTSSGSERDHLLVIHQVEYQNFVPLKIWYSHAVAYPEDGVYGTGIRQGVIEIEDPNKSIIEAKWTEDGKENANSRIFNRAKISNTEVRRLRWW